MGTRHVLSPLKIKALTLKNRVVRAAHGTNIGNGKLDERLIAYHVARAEGGVGLSILETLGMHWSSPSGGFQLTPDLVERYQNLMRAVRPHGMAIFQQLWHSGNTRLPRDGSPPWSCSDVPNIRNKTVPIPMSKAMIDEIVATFASSAALCEQGGLDGVEVHGAHSYLVQQFLSPLTNFRTDEYGGSFDNRMRFMLEVMRAIRAAVSPEFVVGIRLSTEEVPGGLTGADNAEVIRRLEAEQLIDFVDLSMGGYYNEPPMIGTMAEANGYELPSVNPAADAATVPVIVAGRYRTLEEADQTIAQGQADLITMVRANIADPDLVRKTIAGGAEDVRPCIGCNHGCIGAPQEGSLPHMGCTVNPMVGREWEFSAQPPPHTGPKRRVLVIGGGPAGMEAARLARLRGLDVVLVEASNRLGGAIDVARRAPRRYGIADITDWMQRQIYKLGVDVRTDTYVEADDIGAFSPDAVIVATGSTPRMDGYQTVSPGERMQGVDQPHVLSTLDLLSQPKADFGAHAVVWDDVGHYEGIAASEFLIDRGLKVTCVTGNISFAHRMEHSFTTLPALERLTRDGRFTILPRHKILQIGRNDMSVCAVYNSNPFSIPADTVVLVSYNRPNRELVDALTGTSYELQVVGDANSPRYLMLAIREGNMAGRKVLSGGDGTGGRAVAAAGSTDRKAAIGETVHAN